MRWNYIFRWYAAGNRPANTGSTTCGWGRGQCAAMVGYNVGLYDYVATNGYYCFCECKSNERFHKI